MAKVAFRFLNRAEVQGLLPSTQILLEVIERGLLAHGAGEVVLPPKSHIHLDDRFNGHFNILPGFVAPVEAAGVKVVGDYVDNYKAGLPSEVAMLTLYDPATGVPRCLMDATLLTCGPDEIFLHFDQVTVLDSLSVGGGASIASVTPPISSPPPIPSRSPSASNRSSPRLNCWSRAQNSSRAARTSARFTSLL